ncbi:MAG: N-acetylmuramoyl-L-alanine amidase, partial [Parasporobacterium sp.]|nr:N-acetylmuramoyl-L-alanine amidase [Parasporobacterium sp.]
VTGNEASFYVKISDHKGELGEYITHVYLYDMKDRLDLKGVTVVVGTAKPVDESPKIQNVQISEVSQTGYRVTAQISAPAGVKEVLMPTWTSANGQDDLIWHKAEVSGNTASVYIYTADHRNEGGTYITHIYLTDSKNRTVIVGTGAEVPWRQAPPAGHIVCLDAGHQAYGIATLEPNGPGSSVMKAKLSSGTAGVATGVAERDLNLTIALKLKAELIARGYQVVMIRETNDCTLSNAERAVVANNSGAEIFVRIHANSSANPAVSGAMFYAPSTANPFMTGNVINGSINLAQIMLNSFCAATGAVNRGLLLDDTMTGINWCTIPVTIAEMGFMSNPDEDIRMQDPAYQARMVQGLANGIDGYFGIVR